jgi:c(7)-type cytochrome triheme protein
MEAAMRRGALWMLSAALAVGVGATGAAVAQSMPKLPADITLKQSGDSPGKVTFSHASHLSYQAKPDCTVCHPKLAPITKAAPGVKREPATHAAMLKGQACGACHGKTAHNFDDCSTCHK